MNPKSLCRYSVGNVVRNKGAKRMFGGGMIDQPMNAVGHIVSIKWESHPYQRGMCKWVVEVSWLQADGSHKIEKCWGDNHLEVLK